MKTKQFFLILAAITFAGSALANGSTPKTVVAVAPIIAPTSDFTSHYNYDPAVSGIVLGVEAGIDTLATPRSQMFDPQAISGSQRNRAHDFAWGVNLGYKWAVERNALVGVELGYKDFGQSEYKATVNSSSAGIPTGDWKREIRERALDALVTGTYILPYNFNLFGKMGVAAVRSETMQDSPGGVADTNRHNRVYGLRPEVELGFGYVFKEFNIYVAYDHMFGASEDDSRYSNGSYTPTQKIYSTNTALIGLTYSFNFDKKASAAKPKAPAVAMSNKDREAMCLNKYTDATLLGKCLRGQVA